MRSNSHHIKNHSLISRLHNDERGVILILFALLLPVFVAAAALVTNYGGLYFSGSQTNYPGPMQEKLSMQIAADAAARTASMVQALEGAKFSMVQAEANAITRANNYQNGVDGVVVEVNVPPKSGNYTAYHFNAVEVIITKPYRFLLGFFFGGSDIELKVRSVAAWAFAPCIIALNESSQGTSGVVVSGTGTEISVPCGIYSNNPSLTESVTVSGGAKISTYIVGMVGGTDDAGAGLYGIDGPTPVINSGMQPFIDPYKNLNMTAPSGLTSYGTNNTNWDLQTSFSPGLYPYGINFQNAAYTHTFEPGIYYFPPGASLDVSGGTLNATGGVTFVFGPGGTGNFSFSGGSNTTINLTAPSSGPFAGIAIATRSDSNQRQGFNGAGATANINGVIYAPKLVVNYNAEISNDKNCLTLVAFAVTINGGASLGKACPSTSMNGSGFRAAGLVE
jgi:hypothetical protein